MKLILVILILFNISLFADTNEDDFYLDAIVFKSDSTKSEGRVDVMILIPYSSVTFKKENERFVSEIEVGISFWTENSDDDEHEDNKKNKVESVHISKKIIARNYLQTKGGNADFVRIFKSFHLPSGKFKVTAEISSRGSSKEYKRTKKIQIPEFSKFNFSLSGLMLLSSVEEKGDGFKITPFAKDNVKPIMSDGFFVFFETYSKLISDEKISLKYLIKNSEGDSVKIGKSKVIEINKSRQQHFLLISGADDLSVGSFKLQVIAKSQSGKTIAMSERSIKNTTELLAEALEDIDRATSQLRYVARSVDIEKIEKSKNEKEKQKRFFAFWDELDPTPRTQKNEAMEQYYARVKYAEKKLEGWNTDRGRIFIVLGPPENISKSYMSNSSGEYEVWLYSDNKRFVFLDRNGFGDFRLYQPFGFSEKYEYK